ncbi:MAG: hypothetical protein JXA49_11020 [Actinobacteria bacterium]|nr:hypothetical protein [Actinomycetota bacterium]
MEEEIREQNGPIGAMAKVSRELINTPMFKKQIQLILNELDPENIPSLIHTLIWEDPDFFLQMIDTTSAVINILIEVYCELIRNISQFQAPVLIETISSIAKRIDVKTIGESVGIGQMLLADIVNMANSNPDVAETIGKLGKGAIEGYKHAFAARGTTPTEYFNPAVIVNMAIKAYKGLLQNSSQLETPAFIESVSKIVKGIDAKTVGESLGMGQILLTDILNMADSNPAVAETMGGLGKDTVEGYREAFAAHGTTPEDYFNRIVQFGLKMTSLALSWVNTELQKPDSIIKKTIQDMTQNMMTIVRDNPALMTEMISLALSMWQNMFPGAGAKRQPQQPPSA